MGSETRYRNELLSFKKHIKKLRKEKGLTQKQLEEKSTITQSQISLLENEMADSNPELETLVKLAFGFKTHMASLFDYSFKLDPAFNKKYKSIH